VGIGATVEPCTGAQSDGAGFLDSLFAREDKAFAAVLHPNPVDAEWIKARVVQALPDAQKFDGASVAQPVAITSSECSGFLRLAGSVKQMKPWLSWVSVAMLAQCTSMTVRLDLLLLGGVTNGFVHHPEDFCEVVIPSVDNTVILPERSGH
jgi:hypothetical protein